MKKLIVGMSLAALLIGTSANATVYVPVPPKPVIPHYGAGGSAAGASAVGGFLGFVAVLAGYDFARRWTCIGDPWGLGGPGFSEPMPATGNIKAPPACGRTLSAKKKKPIAVRW